MLFQELHVNISKIAVTWWIMLNQFSQFLEDLTSGAVLKKNNQYELYRVEWDGF